MNDPVPPAAVLPTESGEGDFSVGDFEVEREE